MLSFFISHSTRRTAPPLTTPRDLRQRSLGAQPQQAQPTDPRIYPRPLIHAPLTPLFIFLSSPAAPFSTQTLLPVYASFPSFAAKFPIGREN